MEMYPDASECSGVRLREEKLAKLFFSWTLTNRNAMLGGGEEAALASLGAQGTYSETCRPGSETRATSRVAVKRLLR